MIFVHNLYYREGRVDNEHEISLLHFIERQITCFSVEQCNKEGNEDNIVPPACQGPVHHFSPKTTHQIIWRGIFTNKKYNKLEVREPSGPWLLAGGSMQKSKARGASVTRPLLRLKCSLFSGSDTPLTHYETSVWATLVCLLFMTCLISGFVPLALSDQIHLPKYLQAVCGHTLIHP